MNRGAWHATIHGGAKSDMTERLSTHNSTLQSVLHITILDLITVGRD